MFVFLILFILFAAAFVLISLFFPHVMPWYRPHLILTKSEIKPINEEKISSKPVVVDVAEDLDGQAIKFPIKDQVARLESILLEKNKMINHLQKELAAERDNRGGYEKLQLILEKEIEALKAKNKKLKEKVGVE